MSRVGILYSWWWLVFWHQPPNPFPHLITITTSITRWWRSTRHLLVAKDITLRSLDPGNLDLYPHQKRERPFVTNLVNTMQRSDPSRTRWWDQRLLYCTQKDVGTKTLWCHKKRTRSMAIRNDSGWYQSWMRVGWVQKAWVIRMLRKKVSKDIRSKDSKW